MVKIIYLLTAKLKAHIVYNYVLHRINLSAPAHLFIFEQILKSCTDDIEARLYEIDTVALDYFPTNLLHQRVPNT